MGGGEGEGAEAGPCWRKESTQTIKKHPPTHTHTHPHPHTPRTNTHTCACTGGLLAEGSLYTQYLLEVLKEACPAAELAYPAVEPAEAAAWLAANSWQGRGQGQQGR